MASYQYTAKWKQGDSLTLETNVADDVFDLGPAHLATVIKSNIAMRHVPPLPLRNIEVQVGQRIS